MLKCYWQHRWAEWNSRASDSRCVSSATAQIHHHRIQLDSSLSNSSSVEITSHYNNNESIIQGSCRKV